MSLAELPRLTVRVAGHRMSSWRACALAGLVSGSAWFAWCGLREDAGLALIGSVIGADLAGYRLLNVMGARRYGIPRICLLVYLAATASITIGVTLLFGRPVLVTLELWLHAMTLLMAFGRTGCALGGCCHGKPASWGLVYPWRGRDRHFPVQLLEAAVLVALFFAGIPFVLQPRGVYLLVFATGYGLSRFGLELLRGDTTRPYFLRLSLSQWISLVLLGGAGTVIFNLT